MVTGALESSDGELGEPFREVRAVEDVQLEKLRGEGVLMRQREEFGAREGMAMEGVVDILGLSSLGGGLLSADKLGDWSLALRGRTTAEICE